MKKEIGIGVVSMFITLFIATPTQAIDGNSMCLAWCATATEAKHVAGCTQTMETGVSRCAQAVAPCPMHN
jgi:hypothetical protein